MSEQAGSSVAVIQERQALLARQHDAVAEADRELADVLASAHAAMRKASVGWMLSRPNSTARFRIRISLPSIRPWERVSFKRSWSPSSARS